MSKTRLLCGANVQDVEGVVGKTLGEVRSAYHDVLSIPPDAQARVGGEPAGNEHVIQQGESFEFVRPVGSKG